ncbi:MAG: hypothetical protein R6U98_06550 [Pirellulaceae bacterium]
MIKRLWIAIFLVLWWVPLAHGAGVSKGRINGDGKTQALNVDDDGRQVTRQIVIDECDATTGWAGLNTDTTGVAAALDHVFGAKSLEFDKVDGAANTVFGVVAKTLSPALNLTTLLENSGVVQYSLNVSALTDIDYCLLRLGTDSSNYNEWRVSDDDLSTGWNLLRFNIDVPSTAGNTGDGWSSGAVTYVAVGCAFDAQDDTIADVRVDHIVAYSGQLVSSEVGVSAGVSPSWTTLLTAIKTALEIVDDWDGTHGVAIGYDGPLVLGSARSSQETAVVNGEYARLVLNLYGELVLAGYSWTADAVKTLEQNPVSEHHDEDTICELENITTNTTDYCDYIDMDGYKTLGVHCIADTAPTDTCTYTIECTVQDDGTAPAACSYLDVTMSFKELGGHDHNASYVDEETILISYFDIPVKYCRVKYVTSNDSGDDADLTCFVKKMY